MEKYYISLKHEGVIYNIFVVSYDKDGGHFISDLSERKGEYHISKIKLNLAQMRRTGTHLVKKNKLKEWVIKEKPKLIHHPDGSAQISGPGIRSGFFKFLKIPKGVSTRGPHFNDGGPIFGFLFWGLQGFVQNKSKNVIVFEKSDFHSDLGKLKTPNKRKAKSGYIIEAFYRPKSSLKYFNSVTRSGLMQHPNFGVIPVKFVPPHPSAPGLIILSCRRTKVRFKSEHGFSYGGGVSAPDRKRNLSQINVIFPFKENVPNEWERPQKNLSFNMKMLILSRIDDFVSRFTKKKKTSL